MAHKDQRQVETREGVVASHRRDSNRWFVDRTLRIGTALAVFGSLALVAVRGSARWQTIGILGVIFLVLEAVMAVRWRAAWRDSAYVTRARGRRSRRGGSGELRADPRDQSGLNIFGLSAGSDYQSAEADAAELSPEPIPRLPSAPPHNDDDDPATYEVHPEALRRRDGESGEH